MNGFTFPQGNKTVFVETRYKKKTKPLARKILNKMGLPDGRAEELLYWLRKGNLTYKNINNERWYLIDGKDFHEVGPETDLTIISID